MEQEIKVVEQTWELVPLPNGHRPITLKWVFKLKKDELGGDQAQSKTRGARLRPARSRLR
jgi:hypothetical protein